MLLCTVRACGLPLTPEGRSVACGNGHSFDIARSGYINLLQPQDRRSKQPGDSAEAVAGRRRIYEHGVAEPLLAAIGEFSGIGSGDVVLDAGCGDGYYLGEMASRANCRGWGLDISIPAIEAAARRYTGCEWIVANADRFIPYSDGSFSLVTSITARMNPSEFRRVLRRDGRLLIALPAPDDLIELRGSGREDRVARTVAEFGSSFQLRDQRRVTTRALLDADLVEGLLKSVYRPMGIPATAAAGSTEVTFSLDLLIFAP
jgi:23S rRNA (guanine745-N1)-methyltransferase